jgi:hypothetical protein
MLVMACKFVFAALGGKDQHRHVQGRQGDGALHPEEGRFVDRLFSNEQESRVHADPEDENGREEDDESWTGRPSGEATHEPLQWRRLAFMLVTQLRKRLDCTLYVC